MDSEIKNTVSFKIVQKKKKEVLRCEFYKACIGLLCLKVFNADGRYQRRPI